MIIVLTTSAFLLATICFYWQATRSSKDYDQAFIGNRNPVKKLVLTLLLGGAVASCFLLTFHPPKGFDDLFLRYLGDDFSLSRNGTFMVGNDLDGDYLESRLAHLAGRVFILENRNGALWLVPKDSAYPLTIDGTKIDGPVELARDVTAAIDEGRELMIATRGRQDLMGYRLRFLARDLKEKESGTINLLLYYRTPAEQAVLFPEVDERQPAQRDPFILITNRRYPSVHDEIQFPVSSRAGPVLAKLEPITGRTDAVRLVTPRDRTLLEVGRTAKLGAFESRRQAHFQLTDRSFLQTARVDGLLALIFLLNGAVLVHLLRRSSSPTALAVYLICLYLLSLRLVVGVRAASLYPYSYESFSTAVAGLVLLPLYILSIRILGKAAGDFADVGGTLWTPGGRYQRSQYLKRQAANLGQLMLMTVPAAIFLYKLPGSRDEPGPDTVLILLAFIPLVLLAASFFMRWCLRRLPVHADLEGLRGSQSLFANLVEADAVMDPYWLRRHRRTITGLLWLLGAVAVGAGLWAAYSSGFELRRPLRLAVTGGLLLLAGALVLWLPKLGGRGWLGNLRRRCEQWLDTRGTLGNVLRYWWRSPGGRLTALATLVVLGVAALGQRESLFTQPRIPLMLFYTFLFLAVATANMIFIAKKAGEENLYASMFIAFVTLAPLGLYVLAAADYGSAIALLFPVLAILSFAVMKRRGTLAVLGVTLFILLVGPPAAQRFGGEYIRYRMASVLLGPDALAENPTRMAQNTLEQIKQMRFYATAGDSWLTGLGYGNSPITPSLRNTALNDNVYSTLILSELGPLQGALLGLVYLLLFAVVMLRLLRPRAESRDSGLDSPGIHRPSLARASFLLGLCLSVVFIANYMMAANIGAVPLTGKNLPLLGMNSKSDLLLHLLVFSAMISSLLSGLVTTTTTDSRGEKVVPLRMEQGDRKLRARTLAVVSGLTVLTAILIAGGTLVQWHLKPDDVIRFGGYTDRLQKLANVSNDYFRRASEKRTQPGEVPPLAVERKDGRLQLVTNEQVVATLFPEHSASYLGDHIQEFNTRSADQRSIFQLRQVERGGNPGTDYRIRIDDTYMNIGSPFRSIGWQGEILTGPSAPRLSLMSMGSQKSIELTKERIFMKRPKLRLIPAGKQVLVERADLEWQEQISFKANGYDFHSWNAFRPPPKFLVLAEDDYILGPNGSYLVTFVSDTKLSSIKRVNGRLERAYPQGESFYYARPLATRVGGLITEQDLEPPEGEIRLTLDAPLNRAIYDAIRPLAERGKIRDDRERRIAVTVMDLASGDLLALASAPSLDPNLDQSTGLPRYRQIVFENHNLRKHPMGSAIKPFFAGAALQAFPELARLRVGEDCGKIDSMFGFPFGSELSGSFGASSIEDYLAKSSNAFEIYLATMALALDDGKGDRRQLRFSDQPLQDCYPLSWDDRRIERIPDFGDRLSIVEGRDDSYTAVDKLDESALASSFYELFGIHYQSEQRSYFEPQLWEPVIEWLGAADRTGEVSRKLEERLEIDAALPDLSIIPFDRLAHFRNDFLSTTVGGSEGRLHNVKVAEALALLVTGKQVSPRLIEPVLSPETPADDQRTGDESTAATPENGSLRRAEPASDASVLERSDAIPLSEPLRARIASGLAQVFKPGGTGRPDAHQSLLHELRSRRPGLPHGLAILGKTGTHYDRLDSRPTIVGSMIIAAVGRPENGDEGSRLTEGFVVAVYIEDTQQHHATELLYRLIPALVGHPNYRQWNLEF